MPQQVFWCQVDRQAVQLKPHFHDTYSFGLISRGLSRYRCGMRQFETNPDTAHLMNPGDVHSAAPAADGAISYTTFHVPLDHVRSWMPGSAEPVFCHAIDARPRVTAAMRAALEPLHDSAAQALAVESMLASVLPLLMGHERLVQPVGAHPAGLARARDYLATRHAGPVPLAELAAVANMERSHFVRQFKRHFGLPPHQMLQQMRVIAARERLFAGAGAADAAVASGFCDQSHLIRNWRAVYAVPPSRLHKVNFVQSRRPRSA
ncbi:MAG TPA: AraC family transcriptional regulator [Pseudorhodoferax sp.]|jgi:AraC-like DNA-binding protein|nr:AraC family transcriptional regulator [Pseudorhodoferax sp.]